MVVSPLAQLLVAERQVTVRLEVGPAETPPLGLLEMIGWSADVGKNAALGLPVQRAAFRPASSRRSVEVPVERQQEVAPLERHQ